jgi:hypothetical protein
MGAEVWAVIGRRNEKWTGRMITARGLDQPRVAFPLEQAPISLELGAQVELGLVHRKMPKAAVSGALVLAIEWVGDQVEITLDPDEPAVFRDSIPGVEAAAVDRRGPVRVFPRAGHGIQVPVRIQEDMGGKPLLARLCDASAGGLGLLFPYAAEERLCFSRVLLCEIATPSGEKREVACTIRNRLLAEDGVRYGVEFAPLAHDPATPLPVPEPFEPLWDCSCGATDLLVATHQRCPQCGRVRSGRTRLPQQGGMLSAVIHPYVGTDRRCRSCGALWSQDAKFCARCGLRL